jgi:hypothetical protein
MCLLQVNGNGVVQAGLNTLSLERTLDNITLGGAYGIDVIYVPTIRQLLWSAHVRSRQLYVVFVCARATSFGPPLQIAQLHSEDRLDPAAGRFYSVARTCPTAAAA